MKKTGSEIEYEVFKLFKDEIQAFIQGDVYLRGTRPLKENTEDLTEDAIISFMTGLDNQMQTGALNINVYVPDIDNGGNDLVKDVTRCLEVERFMQNLIEGWSVKSEYKFWLEQTINTFPEDEINQHFVNVKLKYKRLS